MAAQPQSIPTYWEEMCFRLNNRKYRKNGFLFRDTLTKLMLSTNFECKRLTAKVQDGA
jgi:hypothetical protein